MNRSEINAILREAKSTFTANRFFLPEWAHWTASQWMEKKEKCREVINGNLGWDITDFGLKDFSRHGLVLFTLRNGNPKNRGKTYCEKIMIADEEQETPLHFHWKKTEDIINRGGGNLVLELFMATPDEELSDKAVEADVDGMIYMVEPGEKVILKPGQSISLKPYQYHRFYGQKGYGKVLIGEVSSVNDDENDNRFYEEIGRFPTIVENTEPLHLLASDYKNFL
jgi:D-lyxose ketol-isomerase